MKKFLLSILAIVYMTVSSGVAMEIHYCMGKKAGVDFYKTADYKCNRCGMKDKPGCCHDEHKFYKLADVHKNVSNDYKIVIPAIELINIYSAFDCKVFYSSQIIFSRNGAPPLISSVPVFIRNCVFRI